MRILPEVEVGVIGGSGFSPEGVADFDSVTVPTAFGMPSDKFQVGEVEGVSVAFLSRHGAHHEISPTKVPSKANILALKQMGAKRIVGLSAVGSLQPDILPQSLVVPDQVIDKTFRREPTFFDEDGLVAHVAFSDPFCADLRTRLVDAAQQTDAETVLNGGTYVCMEGPQFSTRAESQWHQSMGWSVIGMTASPEARLMREAEMCYAILALSTDMDAWHEDEEAVGVEMVVENMKVNGMRARQTLENLLPRLGGLGDCACHHALEGAIMTTDLGSVPDSTVNKLRPIIGRFF